MKAALLALCALSLLVVVAPAVDASPGTITRCELKYTDLDTIFAPQGQDLPSVPTGVQCYY